MEDAIIRFKEGVDANQFPHLHPKIQEMFGLLAHAVTCAGYDLEITSMIRPKTSDSGIHMTGRALDCVPRKTPKSTFVFSTQTANKFAAFICTIFRRPNGKVACIWHDAGSGYHFHLQTDQTEDFTDLKGKVEAPPPMP